MYPWSVGAEEPNSISVTEGDTRVFIPPRVSVEGLSGLAAMKIAGPRASASRTRKRKEPGEPAEK